MPHALIVDDEPDAATSLRDLVAAERFTVAMAHNLRDARRQIAMQQPDVVLLDLQLPDGNGMDLFADPQLVADSEVVLITGHASLETSIKALRLGAADYLVKPISLRQLQGVLSRVMKPAQLQAEVATLASDVGSVGHFGPLWGRSAAMQRVYQQISRVAGTSVTVLIAGESGTGKEVVAQCVHELSRRRAKPFLAVNCGAISPHLIESEIFGHEKGSFTGAERQHLGFFERAHGGTLFLDEITEMPQELQVKLLRVLETGRFMRVGSTVSQEADVRIIAATNRLPAQAVASGKLREDLFYRLSVFPIELPPLRDRLSDVPLLAQHFLRNFGQLEGRAKQLSPGALERLAAWNWPGNVRELRNAVQRAYVMTDGDVIDERWLPLPAAGTAVPAMGAMGERAGDTSEAGDKAADRASDRASDRAEAADGADAALRSGRPDKLEPVEHGEQLVLPIGITMEQAERALIMATLRHYHHHKEQTAAVLRISLKTLYNRLRRYAGEDADGSNAGEDVERAGAGGVPSGPGALD